MRWTVPLQRRAEDTTRMPVRLRFSLWRDYGVRRGPSCPWVRFGWPDPTQPISWLTQPNPNQQQQEQPFNGRLSGTTRVGRYQNKTFTRSHPSWSTYFLYHLSPFATVHGILSIQLTCLTVLSNNLFPGPLWSSPWSWTLNFILHAFLHPIIINPTQTTTSEKKFGFNPTQPNTTNKFLTACCNQIFSNRALYALT